MPYKQLPWGDLRCWWTTQCLRWNLELSSEGLTGGEKANTGHLEKKWTLALKQLAVQRKVMEQQYFGVLIVLPPWPKHS